MLKGFEHVSLVCSDLDRTLHFYCDLLGFRLVVRRANGNGGEVAFLECAGGGLEIFRPPGNLQEPARQVPRTEVGFQHFALTVDDVDATYRHLVAAGVSFTGPPRDAVNRDILSRTSFCKDPDGVLVEICAR